MPLPRLDAGQPFGKTSRIMRRLCLISWLLLLMAAPLGAVSIETAFTRYYEEGDIRPIRQYFGTELRNQGFRTVLASRPDAPAGQYFILKVTGAEEAASARMTLYSTESKNPATHAWDLPGKIGKWLYLGLTGNDWPDQETRPLAWRIELLDASGTPVAEWKSFLWELP